MIHGVQCNNLKLDNTPCITKLSVSPWRLCIGRVEMKKVLCIEQVSEKESSRIIK